MFGILKELVKAIAPHLKAPILVFTVLVLILGFVFALALPAYQPWILTAMAALIILALVIYVSVDARRSDGAPQDEPVKPARGTPTQPPMLEAEKPGLPSTPTPIPPGASTLPVVVNLDSLREAYLDNLIVDCQRARLVGIDPKSADPRRKAFSLDKLYISLDTKTRVEVQEEGKKKADKTQSIRPETQKLRILSALEALETAEQGRMALLGLPGSGKTTFVRYLSLRHAQACRQDALAVGDELPGWQGRPLLPVIIPLGRLAEALPRQAARGSAEFVEQFVRSTLQASQDEAIRRYAEFIFEDLRRRSGLFLFDGLDEVADLTLRPLVVQAIEAFAARYGQEQPAHRFLVTCRTFSYTDEKWQLTGWPTHELAPLSEAKIEAFVDAWHNESIQVDPARREDYEDKRLKLKTALRRGDRRRLWEIADNPLILTLMAVVHTTRGELPDARALVYEECTRQLLIQWEAERPVMGKPQRTDLRTALDVPEITLNNALQEVAYHAHERLPNDPEPRGAALVTEDLLWADLCAAFDSEDKVRTFLNYCESANGLLLWQGVAPLPEAPPDSPPRRVYAFPHLTFQEYLAARYLGRMANLGEKVRAHLDRSDRWREVVMLLGEHICFRDGNYELMDMVLRALAPDPAPEIFTDADWRALWMAGDLLMLYRRAFPRRTGFYPHVPIGLARLLQTGALSPRERAAAGHTLARLGDPRFNPDVWLLPKDDLQTGRIRSALGFVLIPEGAFLMGSRRGDPDAFDGEFDQHEISLTDYYLARYPVTVAQFQAYVAAARPKLHGRPDLTAPANHPVVNISWHDALAYCRWLTEALRRSGEKRPAQQDELNAAEGQFWRRIMQENWQVMLPSEAEWEKAARGPLSSNPYPWDSEFDADCANVWEAGIRETSAVGCFPKGASYYGLQDLSGNVFEWTRSRFEPYPYDPADGREGLHAGNNILRVLRGGSFIDLRGNARCAYRHRYGPGYWSVGGGFRVGVVSPILISDL